MAQRVLRSAVRQYERQQRFTAMGLAQAYRTWTTKNWPILTALLSWLQMEAAQSSIEYVPEAMAEQGLEAAEQVAVPVATSFGGWTSAGGTLSEYLEGSNSIEELIQGVRTQIADAARAAQGVTTLSIPTLQGYVRYLNPPSCGRCAVLAGRVYPYSVGFLRHPNCDCIMIPVDEKPDENLIADPMEAFEKGLITDLSQADEQAVRDGAPLDRVVNIRKKAAGLTVAGRVLTRGGRMTPERIYSLPGTRDDHIRLLIENGYLRA